MSVPTITTLVKTYDPTLALMEWWEAQGGEVTKPERIRGYLQGEVEAQYDRIANAKDLLRWVLYSPEYPGVTRESLRWVVPEGKEVEGQYEGETIRERYAWDPADLLDILEAEGVLVNDTEDNGVLKVAR